MFVVQISFLIVTFLSIISQFFSLMQTIKEVNPHPRIAQCVNMWSVTFLFLFLFFFLWYLLNVGACICHIAHEGQWSGPHQEGWEDNEFKFHSVTCYTTYVVSHIHVNTTKLCYITCILVATDVILRSLECPISFRKANRCHTTFLYFSKLVWMFCSYCKVNLGVLMEWLYR